MIRHTNKQTEFTTLVIQTSLGTQRCPGNL